MRHAPAMRRLLFLALVSSAVACGDSKPTVDCNQTIPKYSQVAIWPQCVSCHSSQRSGADRKDAPADINFDTYAAAKAAAEEAVGEVNEAAMPPDPPESTNVTNEMRTQLYLWALCGTPE